MTIGKSKTRPDHGAGAFATLDNPRRFSLGGAAHGPYRIDFPRLESALLSENQLD
jgi:hypothetical protein